MSDRGAGHRQRLKDRFNAGDPTALTDVALLELLLTYAVPRSDVQPLAQALLEQFGSLDAVLAANPDELVRTKGLGDASVTLLRLTQRLARRAGPSRAELLKDVAPLARGELDALQAQASDGNVKPATAATLVDPIRADLAELSGGDPVGDAAGSGPTPGPDGSSSMPSVVAVPESVDRVAVAPSGGSAHTPEPCVSAPTRWRASGRFIASNMLKPGLVPEIALALQTFARLGDMAATRRYLQDEGLPQRSRASRATVVDVFRERLVTWNPPSWVLDDLERAANERALPSRCGRLRNRASPVAGSRRRWHVSRSTVGAATASRSRPIVTISLVASTPGTWTQRRRTRERRATSASWPAGNRRTQGG